MKLAVDQLNLCRGLIATAVGTGLVSLVADPFLYWLGLASGENSAFSIGELQISVALYCFLFGGTTAWRHQRVKYGFVPNDIGIEYFGFFFVGAIIVGLSGGILVQFPLLKPSTFLVGIVIGSLPFSTVVFRTSPNIPVYWVVAPALIFTLIALAGLVPAVDGAGSNWCNGEKLVETSARKGAGVVNIPWYGCNH
jgi:hypothetical protein